MLSELRVRRCAQRPTLTTSRDLTTKTQPCAWDAHVAEALHAGINTLVAGPGYSHTFFPQLKTEGLTEGNTFFLLVVNGLKNRRVNASLWCE